MPELPDILLYLEALEQRIVGQMLENVRLLSPFVLRSVEPPISAVAGKTVVGLRRLGKRIVVELDDELFLVIHLMIAGRFRWMKRGAAIPRKGGLAAFDFPEGTLLLTEASSKKRASLQVVKGRAGLAAHQPGGLDVFEADEHAFREALLRENHALKRALTDPRLFSGIGNAYSDEILHAARLSPLKQAGKLTEEEITRLYEATVASLREWSERLRIEFANRFPGPGDITAFRPDFAVHGKFGQPCPVCGAKVQRIRYAENETNYCPRCQTEDRILADRSLSRLLKDDWPKTVEELEMGVSKSE